jgi:hypothetical protein
MICDMSSLQMASSTANAMHHPYTFTVLNIRHCGQDQDLLFQERWQHQGLDHLGYLLAIQVPNGLRTEPNNTRAYVVVVVAFASTCVRIFSTEGYI